MRTSLTPNAETCYTLRPGGIGVVEMLDAEVVARPTVDTQLAEIAMGIATVQAKLDNVEESLEEILARLDELELPYASLQEDE